MQSRFSGRSVIAVGLACTLLAYGPALAQAPSTAANGVYSILIRGYYSGDGSATVGDGFVNISAKIHDESGRTGTLDAKQIGVYGDHFSGSATVMGTTISVSGRVDAADPTTGNAANADAIVTDARIGATFSDPRGHTGRIAGTRLKPAATTAP